MELTDKQVKRLKNYKKGDIVNVSTIDYSKLHIEYIDNLNFKKKNKYRTFTAVEDSKLKPNRPILIIWNSPKSNVMIATSITTKKNIYLNHDLKNGSFANYEVLLINKNRHKIRYDGMTFDNINNETIEEYYSSIKKQRPRTHSFLLEKELSLLKKTNKN